MQQPNTQDQPVESVFYDAPDLALSDKKIKNARTWLYVIAVIELGVALYELATIDDPALSWLSFGIDFAIALVFGVLAFLTPRRPYAILLGALIFYIAIQLLLAINDPLSLANGVIMKILFIVAMVNGIRSGKEAEELRRIHVQRDSGL